MKGKSRRSKYARRRMTLQHMIEINVIEMFSEEVEFVLVRKIDFKEEGE